MMVEYLRVDRDGEPVLCIPIRGKSKWALSMAYSLAEGFMWNYTIYEIRRQPSVGYSTCLVRWWDGTGDNTKNAD